MELGNERYFCAQPRAGIGDDTFTPRCERVQIGPQGTFNAFCVSKVEAV